MTPIGESSTPKVRRISVEAFGSVGDRGEQLVVLSPAQGVLERGRFMDRDARRIDPGTDTAGLAQA